MNQQQKNHIERLIREMGLYVFLLGVADVVQDMPDCPYNPADPNNYNIPLEQLEIISDDIRFAMDKPEEN